MLFIGVTGVSCFSRKLGKADYEYEKMAYHNAVGQYKALLGTRNDAKIYPLIGRCYLKMNLTREAETWYRKAMDSGTPQAEDMYHFAQVLKTNEKYEEAIYWYDRYMKDHPNDAIAQDQRNSCQDVLRLKAGAENYVVEPLPINADASSFSPAFFDKGIVFCSDRNNETKISEWNGKPYLDLYHAVFNENGELSDVHPLSTNLNSAYHEGPAIFSTGYHEVYFTRTNMDQTKPVKNQKDENVLKIYTAVYQGDEWINITALPFCSDAYNCAHPTLTNDDQTLYFVSDMPGGFGGMDIYKVEKENGAWGAPVNAGPVINTSEDELFPTIYQYPDGCRYLYFSTRGRAGLGGLDIYRICLNELGNPVERIPYPINSSSDDFGLILQPDGNSGYFSSSRDNTEGRDNLYRFHRIIPKFYLDGMVYRKGTEEPIEGAQINIIQSNGTRHYTITSDARGKFFLEVDSNSLYALEGKKDMFFRNSTTASTMGLRKTDTVDVALYLDQIVIDRAIRLDNIYYDYNKWDIRFDAAIELDKLVKIMKENPEINIELSSHTDCRGKDKYNMTLSQKRAESAVNYIISQGISSSRIYAKGYGESKLLNHCDDGVICTEDEHQMNRRTEFKVVKVTP